MKNSLKKRDTLLLLSGGADSGLCLQRYHERIARCVFFEYGQTAAGAERKYSGEQSSRFGMKRVVVSIPLLAEPMGAPGDPSVVPMRNAALVAVACNWAASRDIGRVMIGCCADDQDDYADCREQYIDKLSDLARPFGVQIVAPLLHTPKREIVDELTLDFWSCYRRGPKPCGACNSCKAAQPTTTEPTE